MSETIVTAIIISIASPMLLKLYETVISKRNKQDEDIRTKRNKEDEELRTKLAVLEQRVTDLQTANTKQLIEIGILQERNRYQEKEIDTLKGQVKERDGRIHELELQVDTLNLKRGAKR